MIHRSCASSIRTLINRHILRPTAAATTIQTEAPVNIYNWHYLPNSSTPQPMNTGYGFGRDVAGYSVLGEVVRGRPKFEAAKKSKKDEYEDDEEEEDDEDVDYSVSDVDDGEYDSEDDDGDHMGSDDGW